MRISKIIVYLSVCLVITGLYMGIRQLGLVSDGAKITFEQKKIQEDSFSLSVGNFRLCQGEQIDYSELATARDSDGRNISNRIQIFTEAGELRSGKVNTEKAGVYPLLVEVKSLLTGKRIQKKIVVLVDGSVHFSEKSD